MLVYHREHHHYEKERYEPERPLPLPISLTDIHNYNPICHSITFPELFDKSLVFTPIIFSLIKDFLPFHEEKEDRYTHLILLFMTEANIDIEILYKLRDSYTFSYFMDSTYSYILITTNTSVTIIVDVIKKTMTLVDGSSILYMAGSLTELHINGTIVKFQVYESEHGLHLHGSIKSNVTFQETIYLDTSKRIEQRHWYNNTYNNVRYVSLQYTYPNGDEFQVSYNKHNLLVQTTYIHEKRSIILISQCMMNVDGIRFRGFFRKETNDGILVSKLLKKDDIVVFNQDQNKIKVDLLHKKTRPELVIGWKLAKSGTGELRMVKMAIQDDAEIIMAIDYDFFTTRGKERCNKAIVMDIQLYSHEEQSVVPQETVAYSYLYPGVSYVIGTEVKPDSFDDNPDNSCSHGIHFFQNRSDVLAWFNVN